MEVILEFLKLHPIPLFLLGSFVLGEEVILAFAFLAGQGVFDVFTLYLCCALATIASDAAWFLLGHYSKRKNNFVHRLYEKHSNYLSLMHRWHNRPFLLLLITKFVYGIRIFTILYVAFRGMEFKKFMLYIVPCILILQLVVIGGGWLAGRGSLLFLNIYKDGSLVLGVLLLFIVLMYIVKTKVSDEIVENE